jgi:hypothetical protein
MAQQVKLVRVKALKMFKASIDSALPIMLNPGDVVDVDRFMAGMLFAGEKAEPAPEGARLLVQKDYVPAPRPVLTIASDPIGAVVAALNALTEATLGRKHAVKGV